MIISECAEIRVSHSQLGRSSAAGAPFLCGNVKNHAQRRGTWVCASLFWLGGSSLPPALACPHQVRRQVRPHLLEVYEPGYHVERLVELFPASPQTAPRMILYSFMSPMTCSTTILLLLSDLLHCFCPGGSARRFWAFLWAW